MLKRNSTQSGGFRSSTSRLEPPGGGSDILLNRRCLVVLIDKLSLSAAGVVVFAIANMKH
jgi:C-terminal processing protease CtpA/Prc